MAYFRRLMTAEMMGAEVIVLDSKSCKGQIGLKGIVTSVTQNSFILSPRPASERQLSSESESATKGAVPRNHEGSNPPSKKQRTTGSDVTLPFRVIKDDSVIGVFLPQQKGLKATDVEPMMCVIHGKRFMPHATVTP
jgi:hypothetical protein